MLLVIPATRGAATATTTPPTSISKPVVAVEIARSAEISLRSPAGSRTPVPMMKFPARSVQRVDTELWFGGWVILAYLAAAKGACGAPFRRLGFGPVLNGLSQETKMKIRKIGVIGAGQMGSGIAHVCALAGFEVGLNDVSRERIDAGLATISSNIARQVKSGKVTEEAKVAAVARIQAVETFAGFGEHDLVIESATENEEVKKKIFEALTPHVKPDAILATNTSSISITRLAAVTDRPEKFIGVHFMNPVPLMELVELIRGIATDDETFKAVKEFAVSLGKITAVSEDFPAFIVNRILLPMINEAIYTLYEGVAGVEAIDTAMRLGAHHPMGPFQLADFIGLDTCLSIMQVLHEGLSDSKYRPCPLLVKYVEAGWLGRKSKRGFYDYRGEKPVPTR